jgi:predicted TIM-barrel fold metal-dependent hydrolase
VLPGLRHTAHERIELARRCSPAATLRAHAHHEGEGETAMAVALSERFADLHIIDTDAHWNEPFDLWTKRAPAKYLDRVPKIRTGADGDPEFELNGKTLFGAAFSYVKKDGKKVRMADAGLKMPWDDIHPSAYDAKERVKLMDEWGMYAQIVYPNVMGFAAPALCQELDRDLAYAVCAIYNDAIAEWQEESGQRLFPMAVLPFWNIEDSVKEAQRIKGLGLRGVVMSGNPHLGGLPDLGEHAWDPLYEVMSDLDMPINIHVGAANTEDQAEHFTAWPSQTQRAKDSVNPVGTELANARFVTNLLVSDVLLRYPKLKFVSVESGVGWIPYALERVDYTYREVFDYDTEPIDRPPALEMFRKHLYACFWFEKSAPRALFDEIGADNIMWETDFPHPTCLYPSPVERVAETLDGVADETVRKVLQDNAAKLYKIELPTKRK